MVIAPEKGSRVVAAGSNGVEIAVSITLMDDGGYRLEVDGVNGHGTRDSVTAAEFLSVLSKRVANHLQMRNAIKHPAMTACLLLRNQQVLQSLKLRNIEVDSEVPDASSTIDRGHRPHSPVKLLSTLFSSNGVSTQPPSPRKLQPVPSLGDIPRMPPPPLPQPSVKPPSRDDTRPASRDQLGSTAAVGTRAAPTADAPIKKLEETLSTYLLAIQARKGNVVGKVLKGRGGADELAVNELYNSLLDDPNMMVLAAQAAVDVLFAAFEKFLKNAWKAAVGPVISQGLVAALQAKAESANPLDFEEYFRSRLAELAPQNQRALRGIVRLLYDLLDGTFNDGDRGILTAAFAEILVTDGDPYAIVSLLDHFVADVSSLFNEAPPSRHGTPNRGSTDSHKRARSVNTASISSNTSSLRKKFGFGTLSRENSKSEQEIKPGNMWRTLSKNGRGADIQPSSLSKGSLNRSKSTDVDARFSPKRPGSRDRPTILGSFAFEEPATQPARSFVQASPLVTIGEHPSPEKSGPPRKKRRSSLSDLKTLESATASPRWTPPTTRRVGSPLAQSPQTSKIGSPQIPTPLKTQANRQLDATRLGSPLRDVSSRLPSPSHRENSLSHTRTYSTMSASTRPQSSGGQLDEVTVTSYGHTPRKTDVTSNIPTLVPRGPQPQPSARKASGTQPPRTGLSERPNSGNVQKPKASSPPQPEKADKEVQDEKKGAVPMSSPRKLRMQSPQKLRERLQTQQSAITTAQSSLQDELAKIAEELACADTARSTSTRSKMPSAPPATTATAPLTRLQALESHLPALLTALSTRTAHIQADLSSTLLVSEAKARRLDQLYRDANAENEALYARFNEELDRVVRAVRG
ncbi:hypothetical protein LTR66_015960, partial [Elasticomyces elasticus]